MIGSHVARRLGLLVSITLCVTCGAAFAPDDTPGAQDEMPPLPSPRVAALVADLGIDDAKASAVTVILEDERARRREVLESVDPGAVDRGSLDGLRDRLKTLEAETRVALAGVLSPDELARLDALRTEQRAQAGGELLAARLQPRLSLSPEQEAALVPILAADLDARLSLANDLRGGGRDRRALRGVRDQMADLDARLEAQLAQVLDDKQRAEFAAWQREQRENRRERFMERRRER